MTKNLSKEDRKEIVIRAVKLLGASAILALLAGLTVLSKIVIGNGFVCPVHALTGFNCPGCGATRMAESLLHLDIYQAFRFNPFIFLTAPILVIVYLRQAYLFIIYNRVSSWLDKFLICYAVLLIIYGIVRNISIFSWLAPTLI